MAHDYSILNPYSLEEFKGYLGASASGKDQILTVVANGVTGLLERFTTRALLTRTVTERQSGHGRNLLRLWVRPVVSVTSLTILRAPADATPETIDATERRTIPGIDGGVQLLQSTFTRGIENVTIVYTAGYGADKSFLPDDVALAWLELGKVIAQETLANASAVSQISMGNQTFILKPSWPTHVKELLNRIRPASASV